MFLELFRNRNYRIKRKSCFIRTSSVHSAPDSRMNEIYLEYAECLSLGKRLAGKSCAACQARDVASDVRFKYSIQTILRAVHKSLPQRICFQCFFFFFNTLFHSDNVHISGSARLVWDVISQ